MLSDIRTGHFTSSQIYRLMLKGRGNKPSTRTAEYIEEVKIERRLGRTLNTVTSSRPTEWGNALEPHVAAMLDPFEYKYQSAETLIHPSINDWCGTPDLVGSYKVGDIKCPYTLKSFVQLVDSMNAGTLKETHPEYFWQLVSNAILTGKETAELIVYCPYKPELEIIREEIGNIDDTDLQTAYQWIKFNPDEKLPYLLEGGFYKNLNRYAFDIKDEEKTALTDAVIKAVEQLD